MAIIFPPLSVYLSQGWGKKCMIDIVLTILIYFPGALYALYYACKDEGEA